VRFGKVALEVAGVLPFRLVDHRQETHFLEDDCQFVLQHEAAIVELLGLGVEQLVVALGPERGDAERAAVADGDPTGEAGAAEDLAAAGDSLGVVRKRQANGTVHA
jgi:hypothetical protein